MNKGGNKKGGNKYMHNLLIKCINTSYFIKDKIYTTLPDILFILSQYEIDCQL